jgi:predicted MFS family arabinose efflux permease
MLQASGSAAAAMAGLFAGVIVDRMRRKRLLIITDLGRAILAISIPAAAFSGLLRIEQLYVVGFLAGILNMTWEVAVMAYVPAIVKTNELVEANSNLATTESIARVAGAPVSGALVQLLSAPVAIVIDAVSFVISAAFVARIETPEAHVDKKHPRRTVRDEIGEGVRFVYRHPVLRPMSEAIALHFLFVVVITTIFTLFAIRDLMLTPFALGVILASLGAGFLAGALIAGRVTRRLGIGRTMITGTAIAFLASLAIPLAGGPLPLVIAMLMTAHFVLALGIQLHGINLMSFRQSITPDAMQGRMNATFRFLNVLMMMTGALVAGALGDTIGYRNTMLVGAVGMALPFLRLLFSSIRDVREVAA